MSAWSEEHVETLKTLWREGFSASQISSRLANGATRSAVLGKVHRMNLSGRTATPRIATPRARPRSQPPRTPSLALVPRTARSAEPRPRRAPPPLIVLEAPVPTGKVTIMEISDKVCRWPIGDVGDPDFHFCGTAKASDAPTPYCPYHALKAVQPIQPKPFTRSAFQSPGRVADVR